MKRSFRKLTALLLTLCMALSLLPATALTDGETPFTGGLSAEVMADRGGDALWIFAKGTAITIEAKGTGTVIKAADAANNGAMTEIDLVALTTGLEKTDGTSLALTTDGTNGYDLSAAVICGGSQGNLGTSSARVDTSITMNGGTVGALVGGCRNYNSYGTLYGNANITVTGGTLNGAIVTNLQSEGKWALVGGSVSTDGTACYGVVNGDVRVTITGGTIVKDCLLGSVGSSATFFAKAWVNNAYLSITGSPSFLRVGNSWPFYAVTNSSISGSAYYYVAPTSGQMPSFQLNYNYGTIGGANILTNCEDKFDRSSARKLTGHYITIDDTAKTYGFDNVDGSFTLGMDCTIPEGYTMTIPSDVTLTVPAGVRITNDGTISIEGALVNNGTISGGSIVKVGSGTYTAGDGAFPGADSIPSAVAGFTTLTFAPGSLRGSTKISAIDDKGSNTQHYAVSAIRPASISPGTDFKWITTGTTSVTANTDIPVALNSWVAVYEVDSSNKIVKFSSKQMTAADICGETAYDSLISTIYGGDGSNTTKITATAAEGNTLYYRVLNGDSTSSDSYVYNTLIDVEYLTELTAAKSGKDISATEGYTLWVYEVDSASHLLRGFAKVKLEGQYYTGYTGGLVADTAAKIIYCNGATVCMSAETAGYGDITAPQLYVLEGSTWKAATPKGLVLSSSKDYANYTLSGKASADDTTAAKGTLYLLSTDKMWTESNRSTTFRSCLPKAAEGFENFIVPDFSHTDAYTWDEQYTVGGAIDLANARLTHLNSGSSINMSALTINDGGSLTFPTGNPTVYFAGKAGDIVKTGTGYTSGLVNVVFTPQVNVRLYDKNNAEFDKDADGVYQVPRDEQVTIVAVLSTGDAAASKPDRPQTPVSAAPSTTGPASVTSKPSLGTYAIAFQSPLENSYCMYTYYADNKLQIAYSGSGESAVTTLTLTLGAKDFAEQSGNKLCVINSDITSGGNQPPKYVSNMMTMSFAITKIRQKTALSITDPGTVTYGGAGFTLSTTGGSTNGAVTYTVPENNGVVTISGSTVTIVGAGTVPITATMAGNDTYLDAEATYSLTVNKKAPAAADFTMTPASDLTYDGSGKTATVTAATTVTGMGTISKLYYTGVSPTVYEKSTTAPTNAGKYSVSIDVDAGTNYAAATGIVVGEFTITKAEVTAPTRGVGNDTANTFAFTLVSGYTDYEYSLDEGKTWADCEDTDESSNTITISVGNIAGVIQVRVKEGANNKAGEVHVSGRFTAELEGSVSITGTAKYGETLTAEVTGAQANAAFAYVWKVGGETLNGETSNTLTLNTNGLVGKTITVEVTASHYTGILTSAATTPIAKADSTGAPAYDKITAGGKKLSDANLTIGTLEPNTEGYTLKWVDKDGNVLPGDTVVTANTAYTWQFTPKEGENYNTLSGSVTLYSVSIGGNSSVTVPVSSGEGSVNVSASVSGSTATITVTEQQLAEIAGNAAGTGTITVNLSGINNVDSANIPAKVIAAANNSTGSKGLKIVLPTGTVKLDETALTSVASSNKDITFTAQTVNTTTLTAAQKQALGDKLDSALVVDINVLVNGVKQTNFNGGTLTVSFPYAPKADENTSKLTVWYVKDDGTIEKMGGHFDAKNSSFVFDTTHLSTYVLVSDNSFTDVSADAYYYAAVQWAVGKGVTSGTTETTFSPNASCTRAQTVTFLWRAMGSPEPTATVNPFADVSADDYYYKAVLWAVEKGVTTGTSATTFSPDAAVSRAQAATFLWRAAGKPEASKANPFTDVSADAYYFDAVLWAAEKGVTSGTSATAFSPASACSRGQLVTFLHRYLSK